MIETYKIAAKECKYRAKGFLGIVVELGGRKAAKRLLASKDIQSGLYELYRCGRLDLSAENLVVQAKYKTLFDAVEILEAERRIEEIKKGSIPG